MINRVKRPVRDERSGVVEKRGWVYKPSSVSASDRWRRAIISLGHHIAVGLKRPTRPAHHAQVSNGPFVTPVAKGRRDLFGLAPHRDCRVSLPRLTACWRFARDLS